MKKAYSEKDLVRFLYNEVSAEEKLAIEATMKFDFDLREQFEALKESKDALDCYRAAPKASTIASILRYSSESALETSC